MIAFKRDCCLALVIFSPSCDHVVNLDLETVSDAHISFHAKKIPSCSLKTRKQTEETKKEQENSHGIGNHD